MVKQNKGIGVGKYRVKSRVRRPGIVSKNNSSHNKQSKHYVKQYRGQGR
jgi:hypothetical protein